MTDSGRLWTRPLSDLGFGHPADGRVNPPRNADAHYPEAQFQQAVSRIAHYRAKLVTAQETSSSWAFTARASPSGGQPGRSVSCTCEPFGLVAACPPLLTPYQAIDEVLADFGDAHTKAGDLVEDLKDWLSLPARWRRAW